ncbi:MAG: hypothetical protein DHS20C01_36110 [marine bacterium B5-7]|nr:MAG: hypothetical protein DHS20C01_36110 [marine bacterium B5-7]
MLKSLAILLIISFAVISLTSDLRAAEIKIDEWQVPYPNSRPRDPYVHPDGRVWFCGQAGGYLAWFDPINVLFGKVNLDDGAKPHNLIIDADGDIWFAANSLPYIGRLDPETGEIKRYVMPQETARDPHTLVFDGVGNIWFTLQQGNAVGRLNMGSGKIDLIDMPVSGARPYGIKVDREGRPWVALFGTHSLATIDPETLDLDLIELPRFEARPRRLEITTDGSIWYADYAGGFIGRYRPSDGSFDEWALPGGESSRPYGTALDDQDILWIAMGGNPNRLVGFDTNEKKFTPITQIPNARGSIRHMFYHRPAQQIWLGEDTNFIARIRLKPAK